MVLLAKDIHMEGILNGVGAGRYRETTVAKVTRPADGIVRM